jgi:hypothetical protein
MTRVLDRRRWLRALTAAMLALGVAGSLAACNGNGTPGSTTSDAPPGGTGSVGDIGSGGDPTDGGALAIAGVSIIVDRTTLMLPDGRTISLDKIEGGGISGYQTRDGWLIQGYGNGNDTLSLWLVRTDGTLLKLVEKAEAPVAVADDGRRIAWRSAGRLNVGHIDPNSGVKVDNSSAAPARGHPLALTGDSVVLGYSATGGGVNQHDVWFPALGEYKPTWEKSAHVFAVYGPAASHGSYLGLVRGPLGGKQACVAEMDAHESLMATRSACGLPILIDRFGAVSPDRNWLACHSADSSGHGQIAVVDLRTLFTTPAVSVGWSADVVGAWEDATTMLAPAVGGGGLVRYRLGSTTAEPVDRPGLSKDSQIELLPRLG